MTSLNNQFNANPKFYEKDIDANLFKCYNAVEEHPLMKPLQKRYQYLQYFRKAIQQGNFPLGMIAYYGPDDQTITKVVAAVLPDEQTNPILKKWVGIGVAQNSETVAAIGEFFHEQKVKKVVMTEGIVGCPHEEGFDFPIGEICPDCTFWSEAQTGSSTMPHIS